MAVPEASNLESGTMAYLSRVRDLVNATDGISLKANETPRWVFYGGAKFGMGLLAALLLIIPGLLTGLIVAICGFDLAWLQMRNVTSTPGVRERIRVITQMKNHETWMLCSLVICTVACTEGFPLVIRSIFPGPPLIAIFISTLCITIFVEILSQYVIPARPITWGYYCWPLIWTCMWLTVIVSWPTALILNNVGLPRNNQIVLTNTELKNIIKYHDRSGNNGGKLGRDACRIMIGALNLDCQKIGDILTDVSQINAQRKKIDHKVSGRCITNRMIISWESVKVVDINDLISPEFIRKVKSWSHSRIPVIGRWHRGEGYQFEDLPNNWDGYIQVYGFLHIKSLLDYNYLEKRENSTILVKDLPLNPIPIIREDMSAYGLLNMFELGMSRMALVIPTSTKDNLNILKQISKAPTSSRALNPFRWMSTQNIDIGAGSISDNKVAKLRCTHDFIEATLRDPGMNGSNIQSLLGTKTPKPVGIVTMDNLIAAIFQRVSLKETLFVNHCADASSTNTTKIRKAAHDISQIDTALSNINLSQSTICKPNAIRKEKTALTTDGAHILNTDHSVSNAITLHNVRTALADSSYTQDNRDDFHDRTHSTDYGRADASSKAPELSRLPRVPPFSRIDFSSYEKIRDDIDKFEVSGFPFELTTLETLHRHKNRSGSPNCDLVKRCSIRVEDSIDNVVVSPTHYATVSTDNHISLHEDSSPVPLKERHNYRNVGSNLLGLFEKREIKEYENPTVAFHSNEEEWDAAFEFAPKGIIELARMSKNVTLCRENSFHDDRARLPSQKRTLENGLEQGNEIEAARSTSFWV